MAEQVTEHISDHYKKPPSQQVLDVEAIYLCVENNISVDELLSAAERAGYPWSEERLQHAIDMAYALSEERERGLEPTSEPLENDENVIEIEEYLADKNRGDSEKIEENDTPESLPVESVEEVSTGPPTLEKTAAVEARLTPSNVAEVIGGRIDSIEGVRVMLLETQPPLEDKQYEYAVEYIRHAIDSSGAPQMKKYEMTNGEIQRLCQLAGLRFIRTNQGTYNREEGTPRTLPTICAAARRGHHNSDDAEQDALSGLMKLFSDDDTGGGDRVTEADVQDQPPQDLKSESETQTTTTVASDFMSRRALAICAQIDPELFFPEKGGSTREAKKICLSCNIRGDCLQYALDTGEKFGIWGGLSERERRKLEKRQG